MQELIDWMNEHQIEYSVIKNQFDDNVVVYGNYEIIQTEDKNYMIADINAVNFLFMNFDKIKLWIDSNYEENN